MLRGKIILGIFIVAMLAVPAYAVDYIKPYIPQAEKTGEGRLTYMIWDVYDAELYKSSNADINQPPLALRLKYLRSLKGKKIADRSIQEMRDLGYSNEIQLADWHAQMKKIFPDVNDGTILTGVYTSDGATVFYKNETRIGRIQDTEFSNAFFEIWLDENTNAPGLRRQLLGSI